MHVGLNVRKYGKHLCLCSYSLVVLTAAHIHLPNPAQPRFMRSTNPPAACDHALATTTMHSAIDQGGYIEPIGFVSNNGHHALSLYRMTLVTCYVKHSRGERVGNLNVVPCKYAKGRSRP